MEGLGACSGLTHRRAAWCTRCHAHSPQQPLPRASPVSTRSTLSHPLPTQVLLALPSHVKVVDLSADFRLRSTAAYEEWYGGAHKAPELQREAVYGLTELHRGDIAGARLVANPGCYPTCVQLALSPLLAKGLISAEGVIIDAKSGVSGAGRAAKEANLFCEVRAEDGGLGRTGESGAGWSWRGGSRSARAGETRSHADTARLGHLTLSLTMAPLPTPGGGRHARLRRGPPPPHAGDRAGARGSHGRMPRESARSATAYHRTIHGRGGGLGVRRAGQDWLRHSPTQPPPVTSVEPRPTL